MEEQRQHYRNEINKIKSSRRYKHLITKVQRSESDQNELTRLKLKIKTFELKIKNLTQPKPLPLPKVARPQPIYPPNKALSRRVQRRPEANNIEKKITKLSEPMPKYHNHALDINLDF